MLQITGTQLLCVLANLENINRTNMLRAFAARATILNVPIDVVIETTVRYRYALCTGQGLGCFQAYVKEDKHKDNTGWVLETLVDLANGWSIPIPSMVHDPEGHKTYTQYCEAVGVQP